MTDPHAILGVVRSYLMSADAADREHARYALADLFSEAGDHDAEAVLRRKGACVWVAPDADQDVDRLIETDGGDLDESAAQCLREFGSVAEMEAFIAGVDDDSNITRHYRERDELLAFLRDWRDRPGREPDWDGDEDLADWEDAEDAWDDDLDDPHVATIPPGGGEEE